MRSLAERAEKMDSEWGIPRHADSQALPAYQAFLHFVGDVVTALTLVGSGILSVIFLWVTADLLDVSFQTRVYFWMGMVFVFLLGCGEALAVQLPYLRAYQLTTYGSARWADLRELVKYQMVKRVDEPIPPGWIVVGRFKKKYLIVLPTFTWLRHMVIFGPTGAGKSKTFFISFIRSVLRGGSLLVIDPKPELYQQTAHHARRVFRLDLRDPRYSDRWNFVPRCRHDPEFAHAMAAMMIGLEHSQQTRQDPFWGDSEHVACTAILMYLATVLDNPSPSMVYEYVCLRNDAGFAEDMANCENHDVKLAWSAFLKAPKQTQGSVMTGLSMKLYPFFLKNVQAVCAPITDKDRQAGVKEIDFAALREPGTAIYIVIPEGAATRYKAVLATFTGQAVLHLRDSDQDGANNPTLFLIDEAYNVPVAEIKQISGVGRGRGIGLCLCYQNLPQMHDQYGRDGGDAILQTLVNKIFLPGLNDETAKYASTLLDQTTTVSHTTVDENEKKFNNLRASETGRALRNPSEFRTMPEHEQAIMVSGTVDPIKFAFPKMALEKDEALPTLFGDPTILSLEDAMKESFARRGQQSQSKKFTKPAPGVGTEQGHEQNERPNGLAASRTEDAGDGDSDPRKREGYQSTLWKEHAVREEVHDAVDAMARQVRKPKVIKKTVPAPLLTNHEDQILNHGVAANDVHISTVS